MWQHRKLSATPLLQWARLFAILFLLSRVASAAVEEARQETDEKEVPRPLDKLTQRSLAIKEMFDTWFAKEGIETGSIDVRVSVGRDNVPLIGVYASQDIKAKDPLIMVPYTAMISIGSSSVTQSPYFPTLKKLNLTPTDLQAFWLYIESITEESRWLPYLRTLPSSFNTTIYYTPEELNLLQQSPLKRFTLKREENIKRQFAEVSGQIKKLWTNTEIDPFNFNYEAFKWGLSVIWSRAFSILFPGQESPAGALVPLADMFNMADPLKPNQVDISYDNKGLHYHAAIDIPAGTQIFAKYGVVSLSNAQLLMDYGFVFEKNKYDVVLAMLAFVESDSLELKERKKEILNSFGTSDMIQISKDKMPNDLIRLSRIIVATEEELPAKIDIRTFMEAPINHRNEKACLEYLIDYFTKVLTSYGTTIEEDTRLLQTTESERVRNAIIVRKSEKVIIRDLVKRLERRVNNLEKKNDVISSNDIL